MKKYVCHILVSMFDTGLKADTYSNQTIVVWANGEEAAKRQVIAEVNESKRRSLCIVKDIRFDLVHHGV